MATRSSDKKIANIAPFGLRMQPGLKDQIEASAIANGRSVNSEIVARLEASFGTSLDDRVSELEKVVAFLVSNSK